MTPSGRHTHINMLPTHIAPNSCLHIVMVFFLFHQPGHLPCLNFFSWEGCRADQYFGGPSGMEKNRKPEIKKVVKYIADIWQYCELQIFYVTTEILSLYINSYIFTCIQI